jgi:Calx-beta domain/FG-GAP-like repeat/FG-GAP repeat/Planctomycete extracellular
MWFQSFLNALLVDPRPKRSRQARRFTGRRCQNRRRLFLEGLEDRRVFALAAPVNYDAGAAPQAIVSADFNNDEVLDLAVANYSSSDVSVLLGNADGTFQPGLTSATGANPVSLAVGDFDEDGILDLATANGDGYGNGEVSVLFGQNDGSGNGTGTFQSPMGVSVGSPTSVAVGDFNGDGKLDLGVTSVYYYDLYYAHYSYANVLLGDGAGGFSGPNSTWLDWNYATGAIAANLNGDTSPTGHAIDDLVAANGVVYVLLGHSSGTLQTASYWNSGGYPVSMAAADVNGDLAPDLVSANYYGNDVSVLLNDGLGGFGAAQNYPVGNSPTAVVVGDFNHDTKFDIATANSSSANISVLYGGDGGTFAAAVTAAVSPGAFALTSGDFNGDGWLDAATANLSSNSVSVLLNDQSWPSAPASLSIGDVIVMEGNAGTVAASFAVTRSGDLNGNVTVNYSTANGGAIAGSDYVAVSNAPLTFGPGEATKTVTIAVNGDLTDEFDQGFYVNLSAASGAVIADGQGFANILDDDDAPTISITSKVSAKEGPNNKTTSFVFLVTLSGVSEKEVQVNFATANGTATTADNDYVARSGQIIFASGVTSQSISVQVKGDKKKESNETFFVNLSGATNATIAVAQGIGEILDDDSPGAPKKR